MVNIRETEEGTYIATVERRSRGGKRRFCRTFTNVTEAIHWRDQMRRELGLPEADDAKYLFERSWRNAFRAWDG
jgi:hypothetical protein